MNAAGAEAKGAAVAERIDEPTIENLYRLSPRLLSGGQPAANGGLETLRRLGVRTIISVDGTPPDVERARELGLRYVHLPIGYDGLRKERLPTMIKAVRELPGPIFIHCHHGRHRGPAAAAACALATESWTGEQAESWLQLAGTDRGYKGLFRDVRELRIPTEAQTQELPADFPESVPAASLVEAMLEIDRLHDRLKDLAKQEWRTPAEEPTTPPELAVRLLELFRELSRSVETERRGAGFADQLTAGEGAVDGLRVELEKLVREGPSEAGLRLTRERLDRVGKNCKTCHAKFRDQ